MSETAITDSGWGIALIILAAFILLLMVLTPIWFCCAGNFSGGIGCVNCGRCDCSGLLRTLCCCGCFGLWKGSADKQAAALAAQAQAQAQAQQRAAQRAVSNSNSIALSINNGGEPTVPKPKPSPSQPVKPLPAAPPVAQPIDTNPPVPVPVPVPVPAVAPAQAAPQPVVGKPVQVVKGVEEDELSKDVEVFKAPVKPTRTAPSLFWEFVTCCGCIGCGYGPALKNAALKDGAGAVNQSTGGNNPFRLFWPFRGNRSYGIRVAPKQTSIKRTLHIARSGDAEVHLPLLALSPA